MSLPEKVAEHYYVLCSRKSDGADAVEYGGKSGGVGSNTRYSSSDDVRLVQLTRTGLAAVTVGA